MGCCVSTDENRATQKQSPPFLQQSPCVSKSPPNSDEESVKEVLSEIPNHKPGFKITNNYDPETDELHKPTKSKLLLTPTKPHSKEKIPAVYSSKSPDCKGPARSCTSPEEISEVSEMFSLSESISTTTLRDRDEDEQHYWGKDSGEVIQRVYGYQGQKGHSPHKNRSFSGGKSPVKAYDRSPLRSRNPGLGPSRNEYSGRRSRSPASRPNVGRNPSGRKTGPSPSRVRMVEGPERGSGSWNMEESVRRRQSEDENEWEGPNESFENPLVSLECFIFL